MYKPILLLLVFTASAYAGIQKGYTILNPKQYINHHFGQDDNSSAVVIGTYLNGKGTVDALRVAENPHAFGINTNQAIREKTKFYKVFGSAQNYDDLLKSDAASVSNGINNNQHLKSQGSFVVIDWDQDLSKISEESKLKQSVDWLKKLLQSIPNSVLKIPAHYLCKQISGSPLYKNINAKSYIVQMYGKENPYLTYESIFSNNNYDKETDGYSIECPKNPSTVKLQSILSDIKFNIQKTLHSQYKGYVGEMEEWIKEANKNNAFSGIVFFDQHPRNTFRI